MEALAPSTLVFGDGFRVSRLQRTLKRVMSVAVALMALIVTAPALAAIALAIKLESLVVRPSSSRIGWDCGAGGSGW